MISSHIGAKTLVVIGFQVGNNKIHVGRIEPMTSRYQVIGITSRPLLSSKPEVDNFITVIPPLLIATTHAGRRTTDQKKKQV